MLQQQQLLRNQRHQVYLHTLRNEEINAENQRKQFQRNQRKNASKLSTQNI